MINPWNVLQVLGLKKANYDLKLWGQQKIFNNYQGKNYFHIFTNYTENAVTQSTSVQLIPV